MFYLILISPLVGLGFLLGMQLFETWVLGDPDRPRNKPAGRQPTSARRPSR